MIQLNENRYEGNKIEYHVILNEGYEIFFLRSGKMYVTRYNQYQQDLTGDNLIFQLLTKIDDLTEENKKLKISLSN